MGRKENDIEQRRSCDPEKLGRITQDMADDPTQATLKDLRRPLDAWYTAATQYIDDYLCKIEDYFPNGGAKLWKLMAGRTEEYYQSVQIRDAAITQGEELKPPARTSAKEQTTQAPSTCNDSRPLDAKPETSTES